MIQMDFYSCVCFLTLIFAITNILNNLIDSIWFNQSEKKKIKIHINTEDEENEEEEK